MKRLFLWLFCAASLVLAQTPFPSPGGPNSGSVSSGGPPAGSAVTDAQCWASASTFGVCISQIWAASAAPSTPASGKGVLYIDSTSKNIAVKDDAGVVKHGVQTDTGTANNYISAIADNGAITKSRPSCSTLSDAGTGCSGSTASTFPIAFVQEAAPVSASATTSFTVTFPQTTAASGNTAWLICALDGSASVTLPAGWTADINQVQAGFVRLAVLHKTTAAESSAAFSTSGNQPYACYFFEQTGLHALDVSSTGGSANAQVLTLPSITPTANSVVFSVAIVVPNNAPGTPIFAQTPLNPNWKRIDVGLDTGRSLLGFMSTIPASNVLTKPPQLAIQGSLFSGGGMAYATFSIL